MKQGIKTGVGSAAPVVPVKGLPEDLGEIILKLDGGAKGVGVKIVVPSAGVKALLESYPATLKGLIAENGIGSYSIEIAEGAEAPAASLSAKGYGATPAPVGALATDDVVRAASASSVSARPLELPAPTPPTAVNARAAEVLAQLAEPAAQAGQKGEAGVRELSAAAHDAAPRVSGIENAISKILVNAPESAEKGLGVLTGGPSGPGIEAAQILEAVKGVEAALRSAAAVGPLNASGRVQANGPVQTVINPGGSGDPGSALNPDGSGGMGEALTQGGAEADVSTFFGNGGGSSFASGGKDTGHDKASLLAERILPLGRGPEGFMEVSVKEGPGRPASLPAAERFEIFERFGQGLRMSMAGGGKEVRIRLVPEHLGEIILKVSGKENNVSAKIVVENMAVKGLLESDAPRLKALFSENGLELKEYSVEVGSHDSRSHDGNPWLSANGEEREPSAQRLEGEEADDEVKRLPYMPYGDIGADTAGSLDLFV
jgi:hypothetical protein